MPSRSTRFDRMVFDRMVAVSKKKRIATTVRSRAAEIETVTRRRRPKNSVPSKFSDAPPVGPTVVAETAGHTPCSQQIPDSEIESFLAECNIQSQQQFQAPTHASAHASAPAQAPAIVAEGDLFALTAASMDKMKKRATVAMFAATAIEKQSNLVLALLSNVDSRGMPTMGADHVATAYAMLCAMLHTSGDIIKQVGVDATTQSEAH